MAIVHQVVDFSTYVTENQIRRYLEEFDTPDKLSLVDDLGRVGHWSHIRLIVKLDRKLYYTEIYYDSSRPVNMQDPPPINNTSGRVFYRGLYLVPVVEQYVTGKRYDISVSNGQSGDRERTFVKLNPEEKY